MLALSKEQLKGLFSQATALQKAGRLGEARAVYRKILLAAPGLPQVHFQMGQLNAAEKKWPEAVISLRRAAQSKPDEPAILTVLAHALVEAGDLDDAIAIYDNLIALTPKAVKPRADKAFVLQRAGRFEESETEFRSVLKIAPKEGEIYRTFLATKKLQPGDPLIGAMKRAWADKSVKGHSRAHLGFALAKVMEDTGQPELMFKYLNPANAALTKAYPFDLAAREQEIAALKSACVEFDFSTGDGTSDGAHPIFVSGLPRSGTTLVEQIIASHPEVVGGGEMAHGLRATYGLLGDPAKGLRHLSSMSKEDWAALRDAYLNAVDKGLGASGRFTDKSVQSHLILGIMKFAVPGARFIIVRRDPRDVALSIYKNVFAPGRHRYAYDFKQIAAYMRTYDQMMAFWQDVMGADLTEVVYEDLVADPEAQTRRLIEAVGLEWDPACLDFHQNKRAVKTLSVHQVRQPIYKSSSAAWTRHEADLQPFIDAYFEE
ncbi:MAG: sulfotransferase [Pseudomonadota bacterium]